MGNFTSGRRPLGSSSSLLKVLRAQPPHVPYSKPTYVRCAWRLHQMRNAIAAVHIKFTVGKNLRWSHSHQVSDSRSVKSRTILNILPACSQTCKTVDFYLRIRKETNWCCFKKMHLKVIAANSMGHIAIFEIRISQYCHRQTDRQTDRYVYLESIQKIVHRLQFPNK